MVKGLDFSLVFWYPNFMFKLKAGCPCMHDWSELKDIDFSELPEFTTKKNGKPVGSIGLSIIVTEGKII